MEHTRKMVLMPADYFDQVGKGPNSPLSSNLQEPHQNASQNPDAKAEPKIEPLQTKKEIKKRNIVSKSKMANTMQILLKLARIDAFDEKGHLRTSAGNIVEGANIIDFITEALRESAELPLEEEFVNALHRANVPPTLIVNERIRSQLLSIQSQTMKSRHTTSNTASKPEKKRKAHKKTVKNSLNTSVKDMYSPFPTASNSESYGNINPTFNESTYYPPPVVEKRKRQSKDDEQDYVQTKRANTKSFGIKEKPYKRPHSEDESDEYSEPYKKRFVDNDGDFFRDWDTNGNN